VKRPARDGGLTLVELLVAMALLGLLGALVISVALAMQRNTTNAQANGDLLHETRLAMERLTRELRQAGRIDEVELAAGTASAIGITFFADFDNDRVADLDAADPEVLTYRYTPGTGQLTLTVNDAAGNVTVTPILASRVTAFALELHSSLWQHDRNGDGIVGWAELDATPLPVGNQNGVPDGAELALIDSVVVSMTVQDGPRNQSYRTEVYFRNRNLS
jgi:prepilin-type N-terminal cleavage/methylation domain-containing protein